MNVAPGWRRRRLATKRYANRIRIESKLDPDGSVLQNKISVLSRTQNAYHRDWRTGRYSQPVKLGRGLSTLLLRQ